jgi:hypothetical protein
VRSHRLFVTSDRIVLVNPNDLRIAEVIEDTDRPRCLPGSDQNRAC